MTHPTHEAAGSQTRSRNTGQAYSDALRYSVRRLKELAPPLTDSS
jgi:hypothetical protein